MARATESKPRPTAASDPFARFCELVQQVDVDPKILRLAAFEAGVPPGGVEFARKLLEFDAKYATELATIGDAEMNHRQLTAERDLLKSWSIVSAADAKERAARLIEIDQALPRAWSAVCRRKFLEDDRAFLRSFAPELFGLPANPPDFGHLPAEVHNWAMQAGFDISTPRAWRTIPVGPPAKRFRAVAARTANKGRSNE